MQLSHDLQLAIKAAMAAGEIVKAGFQKIHHIETKAGKGIVTDIGESN